MANVPTPTSAVTSIRFLKVVGNLKKLKRTGWVKRSVDDPETVASHMYRMAMMTFMIPNECNVDKVRALKMALVHDLAEALVGDITPHCGVSATDKYNLEKDGLLKITSDLEDKAVAREVIELWEEYEEAKSEVSKFVKDFDKFDMILQAHEYETDQSHLQPRGLQEFFDSTEGIFKTDMVKGWNKALRELREDDNQITSNK